MSIDIVIASPIAITLVTAIGALWKQNQNQDKTIRAVEKEKMDMLMEEAKSNKELALAFIKGENKIELIKDKIDSVDRKMEEILNQSKLNRDG